MTANSGNGDRRARDRLVVPLGAAIICVWVATGIRVLIYGDVQGFLIATGALSGLEGYVFGIRFARRMS